MYRNFTNMFVSVSITLEDNIVKKNLKYLKKNINNLLSIIAHIFLV